MRLRRLCRGAALLTLLSLALSGLVGSQSLSAPHWALADGFERARLRAGIWSERRLLPGSVEIQDRVARGAGRALAITVHPGHDPLGDGSDRAELAEAEAVRLRFGQEVWYGFSMRIAGPIPADGNRIVIGQWHHAGPGSPFVAQRFRDGIFHITVQDGACRLRIAWQAGGAEGNRRGCRVAVERFADLPPSDSGWIDMVYHIRADPGGDGLVEVWANGRRIARATGAIGYENMTRQFFKFGPYRDPVDYPTTVYLDNFRRGASYAQVDPARPYTKERARVIRRSSTPPEPNRRIHEPPVPH